MHLRPTLATCLVVLLSLPAAAQEALSAPPAAPSPEAFGAPLPQPSPARWTPAARVGTELGLGLLGMGGGLVLGFAIPALVVVQVCPRTRSLDFCGFEYVALGTGLGALTGLVLGIRAGGKLGGANGSAWAAGGGALVGAVAVGLAAASEAPSLIVPAALAMPLLAVLGYELTDEAPVALAPVVSLTGNGGRLGLQGSF